MSSHLVLPDDEVILPYPLIVVCSDLHTKAASQQLTTKPDSRGAMHAGPIAAEASAAVRARAAGCAPAVVARRGNRMEITGDLIRL